MVWPVWFVGSQLPPNVKRKSRNRAENVDDADDKGDGKCVQKPKGKRRTKCKGMSAKKQRLTSNDHGTTVAIIHQRKISYLMVYIYI